MKGLAELGESFAVQRRVVWALYLRETLTRYGRHNLGFLWLFLEPMIFTLGITTFWTLAKTIHGSDLPIVPFAITGYSSVLMWRNMPGRLAKAVEPNLGLMHHRNVRLIDIYLSRLLLEIGGVTMSFIFLTLFFWGIEWMKPPEDVLQVMFGWLLIIVGLVVGVALWHPARVAIQTLLLLPNEFLLSLL